MIGVFDSGYGGLTILRAIVDRLPQYSYLYFGDNARAPYGSRTAEEIFQFTLEGVEHLFSQGAQLVILACNTASARALRRIQQEVLPVKYPDKKVLGIVVPTIEQIAGLTAPWQTNAKASFDGKRLVVGLLATPQTVASGVYEEEIHKRNPDVRVFQHACGNLVSLIEAGNNEDEISTEVSKCLSDLLEKVKPDTMDALLLGCTHYVLIEDMIRTLAPPGVTVYEQPAIIAEKLEEYLSRHPEIESRLNKEGKRGFTTSGDPEEVSRRGSRFFGEKIVFEKGAQP